MKEGALALAACFVLTLVMTYFLAKIGHPDSVWLWHDLLNVY